MFVCLFLRDSSQAQKLCSFLAGGFEPEPFLGSDSTPLYSFDSLKSAAAGGREASWCCSCQGQAGIGGSSSPTTVPPLQQGMGSLLLEPTQLSLPDRAAGSLFFDVRKQSQRESTQLYIDYIGFREAQ